MLIRCLAALLTLAVGANSQVLLHSWTGPHAGSGFGSSVAAAGDIDSDGFGDVVVGAPGALIGNAPLGRVCAFSGKSGQLLWTWSGDTPGGRFGAAVAAAGDVDADGRADVIVGAPNAFNAHMVSGKAFVFSGRTGLLLWSDGGSSRDFFGTAVAGIGDVDADRFDDFVVSAPRGDTMSRVDCYSGRTRQVLWSRPGQRSHALQALGDDLDGDGSLDVVMNSMYLEPTLICSGRTGQVLRSWLEPVTVIGDVDADGYPDVAARDGPSPWKVTVRSGRTDAVFWRAYGTSDRKIWSVTGIGDVSADGHADLGLWFGHPDGTSRIEVISGRTCAVLWSQDFAVGTGVVLAGVSDTDGDGIDDLIIGAPSVALGEAKLFAGGGLFLHLNPTPLGSPRTYEYPSANLVASGGVAGNRAVVFLRSVNGAPLVYALASGLHGVDGAFSLRLPLEPLHGFDLVFGAADLDATGQVRLSNPLRVVQR